MISYQVSVDYKMPIYRQLTNTMSLFENIFLVGGVDVGRRQKK